jgi:hypothetical protein
MKILKGAITSLASEGRITLQIPQFDLCFGNYTPEYEEVPDEWIITLRNSGSRPAVGRESGFWFLTRVGWEANKDAIKKAFESANFQRGTWKEFEEYAEEHFLEVGKALQKHVDYLQKKIDQLMETKI